MTENVLNIESISDLIIVIRDMPVILDSDVARFYGVATKEVNQAVKNNLDKFPIDFILTLSTNELDDLRSKFLTANLSKTRTPPKAFTEKGLYMLATILKSKQATKTTLKIIETFAKIRDLKQDFNQILNEKKMQIEKTVLVQNLAKN